jgi:hypothetical protein
VSHYRELKEQGYAANAKTNPSETFKSINDRFYGGNKIKGDPHPPVMITFALLSELGTPSVAISIAGHA